MSITKNLCSILTGFTFCSSVLGCVPVLPGQERNLSFVVTGFTLPTGLTWTSQQAVASQLPSVLGSEAAVRAVVQRLVMQAVFDTLEAEGRRAGIGGPITSAILQQITVQTTYPPLRCDTAHVNPAINVQIGAVAAMQNCIIFGDTVSNLCTAQCMLNNPLMVIPVPPQHLTIGGSITVRNIIMANWSSQMWQAVVNRVARSLASGPFGTNFARLSVTIF